MTVQPRKRHASPAIALAGCALAALAAACDPETTSTDMSIQSEVHDGRVSTTAELSDNTAIIMQGPYPRFGSTGMAFSYGDPGKRPSGPPFAVFPTVRGIGPGGAADRAGLEVGDVILASNGADVRVSPPFPDRTPGAVYRLRVRRGTREYVFDYVIGPPLTADQVLRGQRAYVACVRRLGQATTGYDDACPSADPNLMQVPDA